MNKKNKNKDKKFIDSIEIKRELNILKNDGH
jgi:hypothetical protein